MDEKYTVTAVDGGDAWNGVQREGVGSVIVIVVGCRSLPISSACPLPVTSSHSLVVTESRDSLFTRQPNAINQ